MYKNTQPAKSCRIAGKNSFSFCVCNFSRQPDFLASNLTSLPEEKGYFKTSQVLNFHFGGYGDNILTVMVCLPLAPAILLCGFVGSIIPVIPSTSKPNKSFMALFPFF